MHINHFDFVNCSRKLSNTSYLVLSGEVTVKVVLSTTQTVSTLKGNNLLFSLSIDTFIGDQTRSHNPCKEWHLYDMNQSKLGFLECQVNSLYVQYDTVMGKIVEHKYKDDQR